MSIYVVSSLQQNQSFPLFCFKVNTQKNDNLMVITVGKFFEIISSDKYKHLRLFFFFWGGGGEGAAVSF